MMPPLILQVSPMRSRITASELQRPTLSSLPNKANYKPAIDASSVEASIGHPLATPPVGPAMGPANADLIKRRLTVSVRETCDAVGVSRSLLYEEIAAGRLKTIKIGRRTLLAVADIQAWLDSNRSV